MPCCCCCAWLSKRFKPNSKKKPSPAHENHSSAHQDVDGNSVETKLIEAEEDTQEDYYGRGPDNGNPRNKCALQPGHSLMDWIRLGNSGKDLTGVAGRLRGVTIKEVAAHSKREDAWIALKGKVYNITHYLDYHPGGVDELMKGAGKDATQLFDQIHPWVNYESLLSKCLIGPLKQDQISAEEFSKFLFPNQSKSSEKLQEPQRVQDLMRKSMENLAYCITPVRKKVTSVTKSSSNSEFNTNKSSSDTTLNASAKKDQKYNMPSKIIQTLVNSSDLSVSITQKSSSPPYKTEPPTIISEIPKVVITEANSINSLDSINSVSSYTEIPKSPVHQLPNLPKFDWIQKSITLTLIFYTKQLCNPQIYINYLSLDKPSVNVCFIYDGYKYSFLFDLTDVVKWPCEVVVSHESGKIEIHLQKTVAKIWQTYGLIEKTSIELAPPYSEEDCLRCQVVDKWKVSHNTYLIVIKSLEMEYLTFPIGYHLRVFCDKPDFPVRSYTPVPPNLNAEQRPNLFTPECFCLMVKRYDSGIVSSWLTDLTIGDVVKISKPLGTFALTKLQNTLRLYLIAAGTGITPMLSLIQFSLSRRNPNCRFVSLLFFNRTEEDILWRDQLTQLANQDQRFRITNILSEPTSDWQGETGHISEDILARHLVACDYDSASLDEDNTAPIISSSENFICVCGPSAFVNQAEKLLSSSECSSESVHLFLG